MKWPRVGKARSSSVKKAWIRSTTAISVSRRTIWVESDVVSTSSVEKVEGDIESGGAAWCYSRL
eukprot:4994292-Lingulodinium_polyedra.AAC.1